MSSSNHVPGWVPVVIIGGGPTGIAAATLLAQHGIECVLLDRWANVYPQPRAVSADDEVFRILARLGIGEEFAAISRPGLGLRLVDSNLNVLSEFRRSPKTGVNGFPESNMFDQPELEHLLRVNLQAYPDARLRGDAEVTAIAQTSASRVRVSFTDRGDGSEQVIDANYVLGCDGANSLTRRVIGAGMQDLGFTQRWLVIDVDTHTDLHQWDGVHQLCSAVRGGTYMRVGATRYRWEFQLLGGETADDYQSLADIYPLISPWVSGIPVERLTLVRTCEYTFRAQVASHWRERSVFILGDAAHLTPPFIGQGMGAGLRDAMNLAWKLAGVLTATLPETVLDTYQDERKRHARAMIRYAVGIGWAMTTGGEVGDRLRRRVMPWIAPLSARFGSAATPALRSSLITTSRRPGGLAGKLCPNPVLPTGRRFDDVVGNHVCVATRRRLTREQHHRLRTAGVIVLDVAEDSELGTWLRRGRAQAALVRPDRTVMCAARDVDELCAAALKITTPVQPIDPPRQTRTQGEAR